jgi:hypothetical protein
MWVALIRGRAAGRLAGSGLRGVRDYLDAVVEGQGLDEIAAILARSTTVRDPPL